MRQRAPKLRSIDAASGERLTVDRQPYSVKLFIDFEMSLMKFFQRFRSRSESVALESTPKQPIPNVTSHDVQRVVERDFKYECTTVRDLLDELGTENQHPDNFRVQLAALKLANGSVEQLRLNIASAKRDWRDILAYAEYPKYMKKGFRIRELPANEQLRIIDSDWKQYDEWLRK